MRHKITTLLLLLLARPALGVGSAPAWDAPVTAAMARAFNENPLPAFAGAAFHPKLACTGARSWTVSFQTSTPHKKVCCTIDDDTRACAYRDFNCLDRDPCVLRSELLAARSPQLDGLAQLAHGFLGAVPMPAGASFSITLESSSAYPLFMFRGYEGTQRSSRALLYLEDSRGHSAWVVTPDLGYADAAWEGQPEPSFPPVRVESPELALERWFLVWRQADGGMGNNASGFERYTGVVLDRQDDGLHVVATLPLGEATWGRSVTDRGFSQAFTSNLLCPRLWRTGLQLTQACRADPDPRSSPQSYAGRCLAACARPPKPDPRAGYYFLRGSQFTHARGTRVRIPRAAGELQLVERAEPDSAGQVAYVEVLNTTRDILDLGGLQFVSREDGQVSSLAEGCAVDAGGLVVLGDPRLEGVEACPFEAAHSGQGRLELRTSGDKVLASSERTWPERDWGDPEQPLKVFQRDSKGRACIASPSPGRPNPPCP